MAQTDSSKILNKTYFVNTIPDIASFLNYNKSELRFDSIYHHYNFMMDSLMKADSTIKGIASIRKTDFRNNRSRVYLDMFRNGKAEPKDSSYFSGFPTPCECFTSKDTLYIKMGLGFFGGFGFDIEVFGKQFQSSFYNYIDDVKPYKSDLNDTALFSYISVKNKYQYLILDKKPKFTSGQQLTGLLTYTSNNIYEQTFNNKYDTLFVTGKLYFTCKIKQKMVWDR